jgi:hypothetical protein
MPQIIKQGAGASNAFVILPGKQVTLWATGLAGDDYIEIEVVTLSRAPDFIGDSCCAAPTPDIQVTSFVPLMCSADISRQLTALAPYVILDGPQLVTLRAVVHADPGALVEVFLEETDSDGSAEQWRCEPTCTDDTWSPSGNERCVGTDVESEEVSNCGTPRWVVDRPQTWTPTGDTRCENNLVENKEINDCGKTRWTATTVACGFCASYPAPLDKCDGQAAFGFREGDVRDPLATVQITDCDGGDAVYFYPSAGPGHSVPVKDCDGTIIGYGANVSECASGMPTRIEIGVLPDVVIAEVPDLVIKELPVIEIAKHVVATREVCGELRYIWSDGTETTETLPICPVPAVYCASYPVPQDKCDGQAAFGFREGDARDPLATVQITDCDGGDAVYFYPSAGPGHSVPVKECDGTIIGYGANVSDCASGMPTRIEIGTLPAIKIDQLPELDIGKLPELKIGDMPVIEIKRHVVAVTRVDGEVWTTWSDGTKQIEVLPSPEVAPAYCASIRLNGGGYGYHANDQRDPAATVVIEPCAGDTSVDKIYLYPAAGPGHTARQNDCDGNLIGYGANRSDCAADCGCPKDPVINVTNKFNPTTNVAAPDVNVTAPDVNVTLPAPTLVAHALSTDGVLTSTLSDGSVVTSNPLPSC